MFKRFAAFIKGLVNRPKKSRWIKSGDIILGNPISIPDCDRCGENNWFPIPDSLAIACKCGFVLVGGPEGYTPGATLQEWARDLYEAKQRQEESN